MVWNPCCCTSGEFELLSRDSDDDEVKGCRREKDCRRWWPSADLLLYDARGSTGADGVLWSEPDERAFTELSAELK